MKAVLRGKKIQLEFRYDRHLVEDLRRLVHGRVLMSKDSTMSNVLLYVPNTTPIVKGLVDLGFNTDQLPAPVDSKLKNVLNYPMYDYQVGGVEFLLKVNGRGIIADEMGLGKTVQAIGWLKKTDQLPAIIVCPSCVKWNWHKEIKKFTGWNSQVLETRKPYPITHDIVIVNYDILFASKQKNPNTGKMEEVPGTGWRKSLLKMKPKTLIIDEGHYLKGRKSERLKACRAIARVCSNVIITTGTPVENKPDDLWSLLNIINPTKFRGFWEFARRYCGYIPTAYGWKPEGKKRLDLLHKVTSPYMIRRKKKNVQKDLPKMRRHIVELDVHDKQYMNALKELMQAKDITSVTEFKKNMERMRQVCVRSKMKDVTEWIANFLESGEKLLVFGIHKEFLGELHKKFKGSVLIDGSTSAKKRFDLVQQFQTDNNCNLMFGNIQALGTGTDGLQNVCSTAMFFELDWVPKRHDQAESRVHRNGQTSSVDIYYLVTDGIEKHIMEMLDTKIEEISRVTDGESAETQDMFEQLYESMQKKGFWNEL